MTFVNSSKTKIYTQLAIYNIKICNSITNNYLLYIELYTDQLLNQYFIEIKVGHR